MEAGHVRYVRMPAGEFTAEPREPGDDKGGAGVGGELDSVYPYRSRLGGLALGKAYLGQPDLVKDAATDVAFAPGLASAQGVDLGFDGVVCRASR